MFLLKYTSSSRRLIPILLKLRRKITYFPSMRKINLGLFSGLILDITNINSKSLVLIVLRGFGSDSRLIIFSVLAFLQIGFCCLIAHPVSSAGGVFGRADDDNPAVDESCIAHDEAFGTIHTCWNVSPIVPHQLFDLTFIAELIFPTSWVESSVKDNGTIYSIDLKFGLDSS